MANFDEVAMLAIVEGLEEMEVEAEQPQRELHRRVDAFNNLSDTKFIRLFRLPKQVVREVIDFVAPYIAPPSRQSALDVETKVLIALKFFASGSYQTDIGLNIFTAVSQTSVSRSITEVVNVLNRPNIFNHWVRFPNNLEEMAIAREGFYLKFRFPGVVGCIDCTHVAIVPPHSNIENVYVNRKNYHSINVQLICDSKMKIVNVNASYPGSTNDAFIWNNSNVSQLMTRLNQSGYRDFYLLGDSGYPLRPWLLTPLENEPLPGTPEAAYNEFHKQTRCLIERCNGLLKMRFRCLLKHRVLHYAPQMASRIVNACVVLHNICIHNNVPDPEPEEENEVDFGLLVNRIVIAEGDIEGRRINPQLVEARRLQRRLIQNYFSNL